VVDAPWGSFDSLTRRISQAKWPVRGLLIQRDGHLFSVQSEVFEAPWGSFDSLARRRSQAKWPRGGLLIERDGHLFSGQSEVFVFY
jgi:hypothetical protein